MRKKNHQKNTRGKTIAVGVQITKDQNSGSLLEHRHRHQENMPGVLWSHKNITRNPNNQENTKPLQAQHPK